ncbi:group II intron reverse transcriptase/maturase [Thiococcus pfennigii]|uniref:group II intron reverse transcriptase/maturase n=1 Tax=Thiococcus pfennigii TaxID=1057 RepID=UPI001907310E|nr:group II intron reverse transcriptase/maturase [Thiococcus pfennigii]MBK1700569.1 group II intron reverse transcriptase/maturase [Thiococcus pfennigii]
MKQTSLLGIAKKAASDKAHRFRNLFGLLTVGYLLACWRLINKRAAYGVDRVDARAYQANLQENVEGLVAAVKGGWYRAKLVLRKYIPKPNGKMRPLGIPAIADKVLQMGVSKILEEIYEQDFLDCSYGYRPKVGALDAVRDLSAELRSGRYHFLVEADIRSFFDKIDHEKLIELLRQRIDDEPFLRLIRKWLKAGVLETDGRVIHPETGSPQGGIVSPMLANIYLHYVLDVWFEETVKVHCKGKAYLCRYADDFVCAFECESDAERFYRALGARMASFGLEVAEEKTNLLRFSRQDWRCNGTFEFLGFEFRWGRGRWGKPVLKRRTARKKYRAALASFQDWCREHCRMPKKKLFAALNAKLCGYYNYYGIRGNSESIGDFFYQVTRMLYRQLNRRSQRRSYNWKGFAELIKAFKLARPHICHNF